MTLTKAAVVAAPPAKSKKSADDSGISQKA